MVLGAARRTLTVSAHSSRDRAPVPQFHADAPTRVVAGSGVVADVGRYPATYGARALIVTGQSHANSSGLLAQISAALRAEGCAVEVLEGIGADPSVAVVDAGGLLARAWHADLVVGVGGGSVIDVAKAIATSAAAGQQRPFREHLSGLRSDALLVDAALPVVAVPTLPGAASETNGTSVITDDETGRKLSAHSDLAAPRIALLDPQLVRSAGPELLGAGLADAFCHALEAALSVRASIASDALSEQALRMLLRAGAATLQAEASDEVLLAAWWATNLAGQALTLAGSIVTHPLAHPLSAHWDVRHGEAVAALEAAVIATFAHRFAVHGSLQKIAAWMDVRGAADDADVALRGVLTRLARYCSAMGMRRSIAELGVPGAHLSEVVRDARASGSRGLVNMPGPEPTPDELFQVLDLAATSPPVTSARKLLDRAAAGAAPSH